MNKEVFVFNLEDMYNEIERLLSLYGFEINDIYGFYKPNKRYMSTDKFIMYDKDGNITNDINNAYKITDDVGILITENKNYIERCSLYNKLRIVGFEIFKEYFYNYMLNSKDSLYIRNEALGRDIPIYPLLSYDSPFEDNIKEYFKIENDLYGKVDKLLILLQNIMDIVLDRLPNNPHKYVWSVYSDNIETIIILVDDIHAYRYKEYLELKDRYGFR